ncbi:MAG: hypothetical protein ABSH22_20005, partial [Tepidisphaeraceae bacterium]
LLLCIAATFLCVRSYWTKDFCIITFNHVEGPLLVLSDGDSALALNGVENARSRFIILDSGGIRIGYRDTQDREVSAYGPHLHLNDASYRTRYEYDSRAATGYPLAWDDLQNATYFAAGRASDDTGGKLNGWPVATGVSSYAVVFPIWVMVIAFGAFPVAYFGKSMFPRLRSKNRVFSPDTGPHWPRPVARVK